MSSGENVLWIVERIGPSGAISSKVFRTREAARRYKEQKEKGSSASIYHLRRATWGPEQ